MATPPILVARHDCDDGGQVPGKGRHEVRRCRRGQKKPKANEINFKFVGHNPLWKDIVAITGKTDTPLVEFFSFCDAVVAREILDMSLEFAAFLPCRVAVAEDGHKKIWLITLDWDMRWLDASKNPNSDFPASLRDKSIPVREAIDKIMRAGASGEF